MAAFRYRMSFVTRYPFAKAVIIKEFQETRILSSNPGETLFDLTSNNFFEQESIISWTFSSDIPKLNAIVEVLRLLQRILFPSQFPPSVTSK